MRKSIVLAADNAYLVQLETTIKSILCHNTEVDFYILNRDIAPEWFKLLVPKLKHFDSSIKNIHLESNDFKDFKTANHINYATFYRFLIPNVINDSRSLYLDCDLIVSGDLSPLFELDLNGYPIAAVQDNYGWELSINGFNAGVLLINNDMWREQNITHDLLILTEEKQDQVQMADQSILNIYFENRWLQLDYDFNKLIGLDFLNTSGNLENLKYCRPVITHFASHDKPWNTYSVSRLRELWWAYRDLDWSEMISGKANLNYFDRSNQSKKNVFIVTWVLEVEHLEYLIKSLPDWHFNIGAPVYCAPALTNLSVYENVTLYQSIIHNRIEWLLDDTTVYLDINHGAEVLDVLKKARDRGVKIFTFDNTRKSSDDSIYDGIFSVENPEEMAKVLRKLEE